MGASVSCISYTFYTILTTKPKANTQIHVRVTSADGSNYEPSGMVLCAIRLGSWVFNQKFIVCKNPLPAIE